jgi:hypothetical protein
MKRILTTILAASMMLWGFDAFAQLGVGAGYVNSTSTTKVSDTKSSVASNGFYAGGSYNLPIAGALGIAPGVYYEFLTSSKESNFAGLASVKGTTTEHYIGAPLMLTAGLPIANDLKLFLFGGPTFQYGIASKTKVDAGALGLTTSSTIDNYDNDNYGRFDVLLGGGFGFDLMNTIQLKVGYNYGMLNRNDSDKVTNHRSELHFGLAFLF